MEPLSTAPNQHNSLLTRPRTVSRMPTSPHRVPAARNAPANSTHTLKKTSWGTDMAAAAPWQQLHAHLDMHTLKRKSVVRWHSMLYSCEPQTPPRSSAARCRHIGGIYALLACPKQRSNRHSSRWLPGSTCDAYSNAHSSVTTHCCPSLHHTMTGGSSRGALPPRTARNTSQWGGGRRRQTPVQQYHLRTSKSVKTAG
eukprot:COSAG01_NODE_17216_length_1169_cov_1.473832_1_plen_198_part_10